MFKKIFVSPQVKRIVIISNKHGIYVLPHELPNDLRLRTLRKLGNIKKISKLHKIIAWYPTPAKHPLKIEIEPLPWGAIPQKNYSLSEIP